MGELIDKVQQMMYFLHVTAHTWRYSCCCKLTFPRSALDFWIKKFWLESFYTGGSMMSRLDQLLLHWITLLFKPTLHFSEPINRPPSFFLLPQQPTWLQLNSLMKIRVISWPFLREQDPKLTYKYNNFFLLLDLLAKRGDDKKNFDWKKIEVHKGNFKSQLD